MSTESITTSYSAFGKVCQVSGEILEKWRQLGGESGLLGFPVEEEVVFRDNARSMRFQKGSIYHHPDHGTWPVTGRIFRYWADQLGVFGPYGYPVGDPSQGDDAEQDFEHGRIAESQPEIRDGADLRGEIRRRGIDIRNQGKRPTCSVQSMVFLLEYQYTGLLGGGYRHLSVEYANHAANHAENLRQDGHYFRTIAAGYDKYGIIKDGVWPYDADRPYDYESACRLADDDMICLGRRMLTENLRLRGRFIKTHGEAGLNESQFDDMLRCLDAGVPVAVGRDHSMVLVAYRRDESRPGGGTMIFRNSYGINPEFTGYQAESFEHVRQTVFDAYVFGE